MVGQDPWTIRRVTAWMATDFAERGIETARLDADLLLAHVLGCTRVQLYLDLDRPLSDDELSRIRELVGRRRRREPIAYILGAREFYGRSFEVSPHVLVPRPDTETLVEAALERLDPGGGGPVIDLCTGSGNVALTLALERPAVRVLACDLSSRAISVARMNAEAHGVSDRVTFLEGDLFDALSDDLSPVSLITANPPYIASGDRGLLAPDVRDHEPPLALFAGVDGLDVLRRIAMGAQSWLAPGGALLTEVGAGQADAVGCLVEAAGFVSVAVRRDLAGIERVVEAVRPA